MPYANQYREMRDAEYLCVSGQAKDKETYRLVTARIPMGYLATLSIHPNHSAASKALWELKEDKTRLLILFQSIYDFYNQEG